jgi:hypothetical protein
MGAVVSTLTPQMSLLLKLIVAISMLGCELGSHSRKGNCLDNACIESFFSHLKTEMSYFSQCKTEEELLQAVDDYIWFYNHERFQKRLNQCAPIEPRHTGCLGFFRTVYLTGVSPPFWVFIFILSSKHMFLFGGSDVHIRHLILQTMSS